MLRRSLATAFHTFALSIILFLYPSVVIAGQVGLTWDLNTEPDIHGYYLHYGTQTGSYDAPGSPLFIQHPEDVITVSGLISGQEYFFALTAVDQSSNTSLPSTEVMVLVPADNTPPDTTPPTVALTSPSDSATLSGTVIVSASASDNIGVVGVQFQLDGTNLGTEDTSNAYEVSWNTSSYTPGTYTLTAMARDAENNTTTSAPITVTVDSISGLSITNIAVESGSNYQVVHQGFVPGGTVYIDRTYTFLNIPENHTGATLIQTANGDKNSSSLSWINFDVNLPVTVYVAHDTRIGTKPSWMDSFTKAGDTVQTTDTTLELWSQDFPAGQIQLGGNRGSTGAASMYSLAIVSEDIPTVDTTPPSTPFIQSAIANSPTQVTLSWSAATDNVGVTGYTLYRDNNLVTTIPNLSYVDSNLSPSTTYNYYVVAHDAAANNSDPSVESAVTTQDPPDTTPPSTPAIQSTVADSSTQATVSWSTSTDNVGVTGYTLYRDNNPLTTTPNLTFVDSNLAPSTTYAYFVIAHDAAENDSAPSTETSVTTQAPPDTTLPTVSISAPTAGDTVSGTIVVTATAADNVGVVGVQFQLDGANLGMEDTTNEYSTSWDTSTLLSGNFTLTAIARDAAGNTTSSAPVVVTIDNTTTNSGALEISNLAVQSGKDYVVVNADLVPGQIVYIDRSYTFNTIPALLTGATYLQTANGDKNSSTNDFLSFDVNQPVTLYVAHDPRITTKPSWMGSFTNTGEIIQTTDTTLELWSQDFPLGQIQLGGNRGNKGNASMYSVAVVGQGIPPADATPPSSPAIQSAVADSSTQATITWVAATDNVDVTGYTLYRDNNPLTTTPNLTFVDTTLSPSTAYSYFVVAHDAADNNSDPSAETSVTTPAPPDTTLPTISISAPTIGDTVSGTIVVTATAADNVGVVGVQFQLDGANLGGEDTTTEYSTSWDTSSILSGNFSLTAIARDAAGNIATSAPVVVTIDNIKDLEITNLAVQSGAPYVIVRSNLISGQPVYIDRSYTFTSIPAMLSGATYLQTANGDKNSSTNNFLNFDVNQPVTLYVAHDSRINTKPSWMSTFTNTGEVIQTSDTDLEVWSKDFPAGQIVIGGNRGSTGAASMYSVVLMVDGGLGGGTQTEDTTPPSVTSITSAMANSSTQATITWAPASDNVGVTGYQVYRDGNLIATTASQTYVDSGLNPSTTYGYGIQAMDEAGNVAALSPTSSITTEDSGPPTNNGSAQLLWQKNSESDLSHYTVYYGTSSQVYDTSINVGLTDTPNAPNYTISGLPPGTYYLTVRAVDVWGNESLPAPEGTKTIAN